MAQRCLLRGLLALALCSLPPQRGGSPAAAAAAAAAAAQPLPPTMYLHFHKAGGSTMCQAFEAAGWNRAGEDYENCGCDKAVRRAWRAGDPVGAMDMLSRSGRELCMVEAPSDWPISSLLASTAAGWRGRGGVLATAMVDPFRRQQSVFQREHFLGHKHHLLRRQAHQTAGWRRRHRDDPDFAALASGVGWPGFTLAAFANGTSREHLHVKRWGCVGQDDFYTRFLTGHLCDDRGMTETHLEEAKAALLQFDAVSAPPDRPTARRPPPHFARICRRPSPHLLPAPAELVREVHVCVRSERKKEEKKRK